MASTPTERAHSGPSGTLEPAPLTPLHLAAIPGVLGRIARERAEDHRHAPTAHEPERRGTVLDAGLKGGTRPERVRGRLREALSGRGLSLLAEIKQSSPSQGAIAKLDPLAAAEAYRRGGAAALSVLTEPRHFGGDLEHLRVVSAASPLPTLRKEFVVHPAQVREAAQAGAAGVLLIVAALGEELEPYLAYAHACGLDALVEVHDEAELDAAMAAGAELIGVNNRDLATLSVDLAVAPRLLRAARDAGYRGLLVAESGYRQPGDLQPLEGLADAVLVGTSLAGSGDLEEAVRRLRTGLS